MLRRLFPLSTTAGCAATPSTIRLVVRRFVPGPPLELESLASSSSIPADRKEQESNDDNNNNKNSNNNSNTGSRRFLVGSALFTAAAALSADPASATGTTWSTAAAEYCKYPERLEQVAKKYDIIGMDFGTALFNGMLRYQGLICSGEDNMRRAARLFVDDWTALMLAAGRSLDPKSPKSVRNMVPCRASGRGGRGG